MKYFIRRKLGLRNRRIVAMVTVTWVSENQLLLLIQCQIPATYIHSRLMNNCKLTTKNKKYFVKY